MRTPLLLLGLYSLPVMAAACCEAWNKLVDRPWTIMSIGMRDWAHGSRS